MIHTHLFRRLLLSAVALAAPLAGVFANTVSNITQVTTAVTVSNGIDYHITSETPFASGGSVDLTKGGTSVVILDAVVPSKALNLLGTYVKISGEKAVRGSNCDIRIHAQGTIIYPYTEKDAPLTVYSEQNYGGTAVSDFGLEDNGGFMNTLTDAKLNNKIRSFKLRRGFMVTFSTLAGGYGYSRCFIAADEDLNMATLPGILDRSITSYRVFKWNDNSKKGLANNTSTTNNTLLRTTSCYSFGPGGDTGWDFECVRHHIHEAWPSIASMGANDYTTSNPTIKTNNEPGNSADDNPATVAQVLANWQALMATGKRLCSPSSHDGSLNWLRQFMDSIDARGWRCDVLDMHCYWYPTGSFDNLQNWYNSYHRPIWVSEWVWGASWNSNGAFASGVTEAQNANAVGIIINKMEGMDCVERYFYWDSERDPSHLVKDGALTEAGKVYSDLNSVVGFKSSMQYVPAVPKSKGAPSNITARYDASTREAVITWHEPNGEYNSSMTLQKQLPGTSTWVDVAEIDLQEQEADYSYTVADVERGTKFRVQTVYTTGVTYTTSRTAEAVPDQVAAGDAITVDGQTLYVGGNILYNGDFAMGTYGWTNGTGQELSQPDFQVVARGGFNDAPFLQAYSHGGPKAATSIYTTIDVEPGASYYFSGAVNFPSGASFSSLALSGDNLADSTVYNIQSGSDSWKKFDATFSTGNRSKLSFNFRWLAAQAEYGQLSLQRLFATKDEALADAEACAARLAELEQEHPTFATKEAEAEAAETARVAQAYQDMGLSGSAGYTYSALDDAITQPQFAASTINWSKSGTYTGGSQGISTLDGTSCWKAQWTGIAASEGKAQTMAVSQEVSGLMHGVYVLSVDAATDHYCISDQHAYLAAEGDSAVSPVVSWDVADLPTIAADQKWQTLTTAPLYVGTTAANNLTATVGFTGSKDGAIDNAYKPYGVQDGTGDQREGSWYATNFRLLHLPVYRMHTDASLWRGLCSRYAVKATDNLRLFTIAGKDADGTKIYLQEVSSVAPGTPCVALAADTVQMVVEDSTAVNPTGTTITGSNGLRGYLEPSSSTRVGRNTLVLRDGYWQTQTSSNRNERVQPHDYEAYIYRLSEVPVLDSWSGVAINIDAVPTGIGGVSIDKAKAAAVAAYYDLNGRRVSTPVPGNVYIRVQGDKVEKVVVK